MLQFGEQNLVAGSEMSECPRIPDEVDAFRRTAGEDDFLSRSGVEKFRRALTSRFVSAGGTVAQLMDTAVDVGVVVLVVTDDGIENLPRLLAARRAVEVDERV